MKYYVIYVEDAQTKVREFEYETDALRWWASFSIKNTGEDNWLDSIYFGQRIMGLDNIIVDESDDDLI